jgi:lipoprotein-anchoring transpeptidase ErfK/SrfK
MPHNRILVSAALGLLLCCPAPAAPAVVGWNDPDSAARNSAASAPQSSSALGGGLLEYLVTGVDPVMRRAPRPPAYQALAAAPQPQALRREIDPIYRRTEVDYNGAAPGTVVIDTNEKFLYFVQSHGRAIRYGVGVGRPGFEWAGVKTISRKAQWPDWTPPAEMLARRPDLPHFMPGGPANPLGARALYLGSSLYRIHGTNEPYTIGQNVSSGCIRMMNEDVTDLYERVNVGTKVIVR